MREFAKMEEKKPLKKAKTIIAKVGKAMGLDD